ncbi:hypothetical protein D3C87_299890 [compost metagenome]
MSLNRKLISLCTCITLAGLLSACSQGFQTPNAGALDQEPGSSGGTPNTPAPPSAFEKLDMKGTVAGNVYDGTWAFDLDKANNALLVNLPIPANPLIDLNVTIPELPGAKLRTYKDSSNKTQVVVSIPLKYVVKGVNFLPSARLPSGDALPNMPSGELASIGVSLGANQNVHLYVGVNAVGLYVESSYIPEYLGFTAPIKNQAGTRILGYFSLVPKKGNFKGGLFVALPLPNDIAKILDDHMAGLIQ